MRFPSKQTGTDHRGHKTAQRERERRSLSGRTDIEWPVQVDGWPAADDVRSAHSHILYWVDVWRVGLSSLSRSGSRRLSLSLCVLLASLYPTGACSAAWVSTVCVYNALDIWSSGLGQTWLISRRAWQASAAQHMVYACTVIQPGLCVGVRQCVAFSCWVSLLLSSIDFLSSSSILPSAPLQQAHASALLSPPLLPRSSHTRGSLNVVRAQLHGALPTHTHRPRWTCVQQYHKRTRAYVDPSRDFDHEYRCISSPSYLLCSGR